ncbi:glucuronokinase 1 isoform X2 [Cryptomeria japonica]|uniref:glucuronokinase 1 isoform X2 n=1 Tax=Cryptomeria japonica TaxID=3369 RepID=UPI0025AD2F12|nr:glucuronokinase 1 isoform X2 [Cryptomeria japonica]
MGLIEENYIEHRAYARVGLLGNPSDVYYGRTLSFGLANFWAIARLRPSQDLVIEPHPYHDLVQFNSLEHLTGLSGSSAIVCAALNCLLDFYSVRHLVKVEERPNLILSAEGELGITAGLQDRVAQVYGGVVYMDFKKEYMDKMGHGIYIPLDPAMLPQMHLIYAENPSDSGKIHSAVRKRWLDGEELVIKSMEEIAGLASQGRDALLEKDYYKLAKLMDRNFDLRRLMFGDGALGLININMVETARSVGAACKFTGSGGAVIAFCPNGSSQVRELQDACHKAGYIIQPALVVPPLLSDTDLQSPK